MATSPIVYSGSSSNLSDDTKSNLDVVANPVSGFLGLFTGKTQKVYAAFGKRMAITALGVGISIVGVIFVVSGTNAAKNTIKVATAVAGKI
jgi:hypothetical protein